jgi:hypothetical protein
MCNIDLSRGTWATRPGTKRLLDISAYPDRVAHLTEYMADNRYASHDFYDSDPVSVRGCILAITTSSAFQYMAELFNPAEKARTVGVLPDSQKNAYHSTYQSARMLRRNYHPDTGIVTYAPVQVFSNGIDPPFYYYQLPDSTSDMADLDSISSDDAGLSALDLGTLDEPPKGAVLAVFQGCLFMGNTEEGTNVLQWTGFDAAGIPVCNFWPAGRFLAIGTAGETITDLVPYKDVLLVFTDRQVYVLSGSGVDSQYRLDPLFADAGALPRCAVNVGDSVFFMDHGGVYRTNLAKTVRVSHPALNDLWPGLRTNSEHNAAFYDPERQQVYFSTTCGSNGIGVGPYPDIVLVYHIPSGSWSRWGSWSGSSGYDPDSHIAMWHGLVSHSMFDNPKFVFCSEDWVVHLDGPADFSSHPTFSSYDIYWFIKTHRYFADDDHDKLLRYGLVKATKTGDWDLYMLAYTDQDDTLVHALRRKAGQKWTFIADEAASDAHFIAPVTAGYDFRTPDDGPVDVLDIRTFRKLVDSHGLATAGLGRIKFSSAYSHTSYGDGHQLVMQEDVADMGIEDMGAESMFAASSASSYAVDFAGPIINNTAPGYFEQPRAEEINAPTNIVAKHFGLWLSGDTIPMEIEGWALWVRPLRTLRPR